MDTNRINSGQNQPPARLTGAQGKSSEEAFHQMAKSEGEGYKGDLEKAISDRTRISRNQRVSKASRKQERALFLVSDDEDNQGEAVYRTVMVDGLLFTLRLLAVA